MTPNSKNKSRIFSLSKNAVVFSAFLALAACGGGSGDSGAATLNDEAGIALPDDSSSEEIVETPNTTPVETVTPPAATDDRVSILAKYNHLDPKREIRTNVLSDALVYFEKNKSKFANKNYLSILDFSKKSTEARFFLINMNTGVVWAIHVAHGKGSDSNHDGYAEKFSNKSGSNASSLGVYRAAETYTGKHGLSLKLDGLSPTNSNARSRAVVIHGASYVKEARVIQGRSWGCPAVANELRTKVINTLKGGSMIYAVAK